MRPNCLRIVWHCSLGLMRQEGDLDGKLAEFSVKREKLGRQHKV